MWGQGEIEHSSSTVKAVSDLMKDHLNPSSRRIQSVLEPYQPVISDDESDIYDDRTLEEASIVDDADEHMLNLQKPPLGQVYKYEKVLNKNDYCRGAGSPSCMSSLLP